MTLNVECFYLFQSLSFSRFEKGDSRASAANDLCGLARARGRYAGTGSCQPRGTRVQGATLGAAPTHIHTHIPSPPTCHSFPLSPKSRRGKPVRELRRGGETRARGGAGRRAERSLEPPRRLGPPTRAPIPLPRDSVTYLINKPSGAGGKFSGAKLKSVGFAFIKRGFPKIPHGFGGARGGEEVREQRVSLPGMILSWGDPERLSVLGTSHSNQPFLD